MTKSPEHPTPAGVYGRTTHLRGKVLAPALPSPALLAGSHLRGTLEEDNFDVGEISGHLCRRGTGW